MKLQNAFRSAGWIALAGLVLCFSSQAHAQVVVRRAVRAGDVTGLELHIEGPRNAVRGSNVRWMFAAYEVVGLSDLRPAQGARLRLLASTQRDRPMAELTVDAMGRAEGGFAIPVDAPDSLRVMYELISPRGVRRQFEFPLPLLSSNEVRIAALRPQIRPGESLEAVGRIVARSDGSVRAATEVGVVLLNRDGQPVGEPLHVRTDEGGVFRVTVPPPPRLMGPFFLEASVGEGSDRHTARAEYNVRIANVAPLVVQVIPQQNILLTDEELTVDVSVRTGDGRPVANARVDRPARDVSPRPTTEPPPMLTDAQGRVRLRVRLARSSENVTDVPLVIRASKAGIGEGEGQALIRLANHTLYGAVSVEGGALTQTFGGRVFARVVRVDGTAAPAGTRVTLHGPRLASQNATTDASGAVSFNVSLQPSRANAGAEEETCGGTTATGYELQFEAGTDRGTSHGCLPVDPDVPLRVQAVGPRVAAGAVVRFQLQRAPSIARWPTEVTLLSRVGTELLPRTGTIVAAASNEGSVTVPSDATGVLFLRARPLQIPAGLPVRGNTTALWVSSGAGSALVLDRAEEQLRLRADGGALRGLVVVSPSGDEDAFFDQARSMSRWSVLGDLRVDSARVTDPLLSGALAALTPVDDAAPGVLRAGIVMPQAAAEQPGEQGILRDPWRSRARFVEGRLGMFFQLVEHHIAENVRTDRDSVGVRGAGGRWGFNRELFDALAQSSDASEGPRALGGAMLSIEQLQRLDPAFTYDNVARRITRRRMFVTLLALRRFVAERGLDLRWSWRGDPSVWLRTVVDEQRSYSDSESLSNDDGVDGWGTPLALRPAVGGRARFSFLNPVPDYELVSAGPDLRFGTPDDIRDPFARVLPSGGAYARAVGEDALLARLNGVELGRATIGRLAEAFSVEDDGSGQTEEDAASRQAESNWGAIPSRIFSGEVLYAPATPPGWASLTVQEFSSVGAESNAVRLPDGMPRRRWAALGIGYNAQGDWSVQRLSFVHGAPAMLHVPLAPAPDEAHTPRLRLRVGEALRVPVAITNLLDSEQSFRLEIEGEGLSVAGARSLRIPAGQAETLDLTLTAQRVGPLQMRVLLRDERGALLRASEVSFQADRGTLLLRDDLARLVMGDARSSAMRYDRPSQDRITEARLLLLTPARIFEDPELDRVRQHDPSLVAWGYAMGGRSIPPAVMAAMYRAQDSQGIVRNTAPGEHLVPVETQLGSSALLSTACAIAAWSSLPDTDTRAHNARARAVAVLGGTARREGAGSSEADVRYPAAAMVALTVGGGPLEETSGHDGVSAAIIRIRSNLHGAMESLREQPTLQARAAAALLLADPTDARGLEYYRMASRSIGASSLEGAWVRGGVEHTQRSEELAGTAALAIAAQQQGDGELALRLGRALATRAHLSMRLGGEAAFWLLAAANYGVFGLGVPTSARVWINNNEQTITLENGRGILRVPTEQEQRSLELRVQPVGAAGEATVLFARLEVQSERALRTVNDASVALRLGGDIGFWGERSALELAVENVLGFPLRRVVLELQLPAGAVLEESMRQTIRQRLSGGSVELRDGGLLRLTIPSIAARSTETLPLPVRWVAVGEMRGFSIAAYLEDASSRITTIAPREISVAIRPEEPIAPTTIPSNPQLRP